MSITRLDVPWATQVPVAAHVPVAAVDVLPGYASDETQQAPAALAEPWSGQTLSLPAPPVIPSLNGMLLTG